MALMTGILYALMAGAAFFVYLCWFRHVRDNVPGAGKRILYYFLVALTFVVLGRATGVSVALGVLPMLVVMRSSPGGDWAPCSAGRWRSRRFRSRWDMYKRGKW